jgi:hypothetical protein
MEAVSSSEMLMFIIKTSICFVTQATIMHNLNIRRSDNRQSLTIYQFLVVMSSTRAPPPPNYRLCQGTIIQIFAAFLTPFKIPEYNLTIQHDSPSPRIYFPAYVYSLISHSTLFNFHIFDKLLNQNIVYNLGIFSVK